MKNKLSPKTLLLVLLAVASASLAFQPAKNPDAARWEQQARNITIVRDDWGIAHVTGKTDADAVFGMIYAQAEDDFNRIETNYINSTGRLAEVEGESRIWQDLRMKLFIDPAGMKKNFTASPAWLQKLMNAWADGLNFYLYRHPEVAPRLIKHFEPWMALTFTEGSVPAGGDIVRVNLGQLQSFYGKVPVTQEPADDLAAPEYGGSNGAAVAPANTVDHHSLLLINPHTNFFFRSELQMTSDEGLNAYGAATWGQFFIYQGFNEHAGWMHTSSGVDAVDEYLETIVKKGDKYFYKYGSEERPVTAAEIAIPYKTDRGVAEKKFTVYRTHHGPIVRELNGKWVAFSIMQEPIKALMQSYSRTKATDYKSYLQTMELKANSSNNTIFADSAGDIAYFHGNYIPRRNTKFDFTRPVDGSDPEADWHGLLNIDETPHLLNPSSGWLYNTNNWPWSAAGPSSPKKEDYPAYVESGGESARGLHAIRVLQNKKDFTLDSLLGAAFDTYLTWFEKPIPQLVKAWDQAPASDPAKSKTAEQIGLLRKWDLRWAANSVPTSLAIYWAEEVRRRGTGGGRRGGGGGQPAPVDDPLASVPAETLLQSLVTASDRLQSDFGSWKTPWGDINRFQRIDDDIVETFHDDKPSIPVGFPSAQWGSLASFAARAYPNTKKWYGTSGNSFVAVVEFGKTVRARAVTCGGESGHPDSRHFNDEASRYATGDLREVYYYRSQLKGHTEREYHPGL
jgi:acyl-homoserine-lactone acylase